MDRADIRRHWSNWAETYGTDVRATTKGRTAKVLELDALYRRLSVLTQSRAASILEVGCGNGINCVGLARRLPLARFDGIDFIPAMIDSARENAAAAGVADRTRFQVGDVTKLGEVEGLEEAYDAIFTDRCLINLNTPELQGEAIAALAGKLKPSGTLLMIENSLWTYARQNRAREALGLEPREPAEFNRFFKEEEMRSHVRDAGLRLVEVEDFSSLHDLILYALLPATNGGRIDYDDPLVVAATNVSVQMSAVEKSPFGSFGQNRLYVCRKG